jgi:hypothetical protein
LDADAPKRLGIYKKLMVVTDQLEKDWNKTSDEQKAASITRIRKILASPILMQDQMNMETLQNLKKLIVDKIEIMREKETSTRVATKKYEAYNRLYRIVNNLEKSWDAQSDAYKVKRLEQIKKILAGVEKAR